MPSLTKLSSIFKDSLSMQNDSNLRKKNAPNDKPLERLVISSGACIVIDQYMLGNKQFLDKIDLIQGESEQDMKELSACIADFGGHFGDLENGDFKVFRDPYEKLMLLLPFENDSEIDRFLTSDEEYDMLAEIAVDTRCLVFADVAILKNKNLLSEYSKLRASGEEKAARDLLRENGASVRYGFSARTETLGLFNVKEKSVLALWPA